MAIDPAKLNREVSELVQTSRTRENGITIVEVSQPHLRRCSVSAYFRIGSRFETPRTNGLSHFVEHMLFRGTRRHPSAHEINFAVEELGGNLYAATSPDTTELEMVLPPDNVCAGARLLFEILEAPMFNDIDIERRVIAEELLDDLDEQSRPIDIDFLSRSRLWPDHGLGQSVIGPLENISAFFENDIINHFRDNYVAPNGVFCISGAFDRHRVRPVVDELLSALPSNGVTTVSAPPELGDGPSIVHAAKPGSQTQVRVAFHAPGEDDPETVALAILLGVLDDGMSSRLHRRIFDECGLAYNIGASLDSYSDVSALNVDATVSHDNVEEVVAEILNIVRGLRDEAVPDDEMAKARRRAAFAIEEMMDDPQAMSLWYGEQRLFRTPPALETRIEAHLGVTSAEVQRVARRVFTAENLHITTVGAVETRTRQAIERTVADFN